MSSTRNTFWGVLKNASLHFAVLAQLALVKNACLAGWLDGWLAGWMDGRLDGPRLLGAAAHLSHAHALPCT